MMKKRMEILGFSSLVFSDGGCAKGLCKGGPFATHFLRKGFLTKKGTYFLAILGIVL